MAVGDGAGSVAVLQQRVVLARGVAGDGSQTDRVQVDEVGAAGSGSDSWLGGVEVEPGGRRALDQEGRKCDYAFRLEFASERGRNAKHGGCT